MRIFGKSKHLSHMRLRQLILLVIVVLIIAVSYFNFFASDSGQLSAEELADRALDGNEQERRAAAAAMVNLQREDLEEIRYVAHNTDDDVVKSITIKAMGRLFDYHEMELLIAGLKDRSPEVRRASDKALVRLFGMDPKAKLDGTRKERALRIKFFSDQWEGLKNSPAYALQVKKVERWYGTAPENKQ